MSVQAAVTDTRDPRFGLIKARVAATLLASIVIAAFVLANLPYEFAESEVTWVGYLEISDGGSYRTYQSLPTMAGWPLRYWIRYVDGDQIQDRIWLPMRLVLNAILGLLLAAAVYWFVHFRRQKLIHSAGAGRVRLMLDCGLALAILAVPGVIFGWQYRITRYHLQMAKDLERLGSSCLTCWLPAPYSDLVPVGLKRSLVRLRQIHVYGVHQKAADVILSVPTLAAYHCYAGEYDERPLQRLLDNPHLSVLQLTRRELSESDLAVVRKLRWLDQLRMSRTNLNAEQLRGFGHLELKVVDLSFTNIKLSEIGKPGWSSTAKRLLLSRPEDGIESTLTIEGWPELKELRVERQSAVLNDAVLSLRLIDLPRLETLHIDRVQKHDLVLRNVPRLSAIDEGVAELRYIVNTDMLIPGLTWVRFLEIDGVDSLTKFGVFARDLESFSIQRTRSLRKLAFGSFLTTLLGEVTPQQLDSERCRRWVVQLGAMRGPSDLDLSFLPLVNEDLSPLAANSRVRHLKLVGTGVTFPQIRHLVGMESLESLVIPSTPLQQEDFAWLLDQFPTIKNLMVDVTGVSNFDLQGRDRLRDVRVTAMNNLDEIRVVDLPQLCTSIRLTQSPKKLEIWNVPSLRGLAVEGPWPATAELHGLRDLQWFTGGGEGITDEVVNEVLNCVSIDRLTLAYPSVSADTLRRIGTLKDLTFLALPGSRVNDDVVRDWRGLTSLWEVNFDDTQVSVETIGWLSRMESLRRLSLNRVPLSKLAADALAELSHVSELYLSGVSMPAGNLGSLLKRGNLETLDLSGWEINEELVGVLCSDGAHLKHLILRGSNLDAATLKRLLEAAPMMYVDIGKNPDFVDDSTRRELHRRAQNLQREMNTGWRIMLKPREDVFHVIPETFVGNDEPAQDQTQGVPDLPVTYMSQLTRQLFQPEQPVAK